MQQLCFCTFLLTPMKCPHLLSNEMTDQVNSDTSGPNSQYSSRRMYSAVVSFLLGRALIFLRKDGLRRTLRTPCNSGHTDCPAQCSRWTMYHSQSPDVSHCTSGCWNHVQHWLVQIGSRIQQQSQRFIDMVTSGLCGTRVLSSWPE